MDKSVIIKSERVSVDKNHTEFILISKEELKLLYTKIREYEERIKKYELQQSKALELITKKFSLD